MKFLTTVAFIILGVSFSACSAKKVYQDDSYYDRANKASEKSLKGLDKE